MTSTYVYTVILDGYDHLPTFQVWDDNIRYICFSNNPLDVSDDSRWEIVPIGSYFLDRKITNGYLKTNSHILFGNDAISLWIDGNLRNVNVTAPAISEMVSKSPVATLPHRLRSSVSEEIDAVVQAGLEHPSTAARWRQCMKESGYADDQPLAATMMVARDHRNPALRRANASWWRLISSGIRRDQLTFNYALWENGIQPTYIDADWQQPNRFFSRVAHHNPSSRLLGGAKPGRLLRRLFRRFGRGNISGGLPREEMKGSSPCYGNILEMPPIPDNYPKGVSYIQELWEDQELKSLRSLNRVVLETTKDGKVEGNYCHFDGEKLVELTPPDLRRGWKREYLRYAIRGRRKAVEIGFNAGHSATIMLEAEPLLRLTSIDICQHAYTAPCAETLHGIYQDRFSFVRGSSRDVMDTIGAEQLEFVHIDGGHDRQSVEFDLDWFCQHAPKGCRLMVDDAYVAHIRGAIETKIQNGVLQRAYCGFPTSGENALYEKML